MKSYELEVPFPAEEAIADLEERTKRDLRWSAGLETERALVTVRRNILFSHWAKTIEVRAEPITDQTSRLTLQVIDEKYVLVEVLFACLILGVLGTIWYFGVMHSPSPVGRLVCSFLFLGFGVTYTILSIRGTLLAEKDHVIILNAIKAAKDL